MTQHVYLEDDNGVLDDDSGLTIDEPGSGDQNAQGASGADPQPSASAQPEIAAQSTPGPAGGEDALTGEDIPEKYRGKSAKELLDIIRDQEQYVGRQSNELGQLREQVGTLRGVVDQAIAAQAGVQPQGGNEDEDDLTADDLLTKPSEAIGKVLQKHLRPIEEKLSGRDRESRQEAFLREHPTAMDDLNDEKFVGWVRSSAYRTRLAQKAFADPTNPDLDAAEELWLGYEDVREKPQGSDTAADPNAQAAQAEAQPADQPSAKEVALARSGGSGADTSAADSTVYSAAKLTKLQMEDPDAYYEPTFYAKVCKAFAEGRVR